jgi:hypothetical protein
MNGSTDQHIHKIYASRPAMEPRQRFPGRYPGCYPKITTAFSRFGLLHISILIFGAGDGIRTHDPNLGKVVLYP